MTLDASGKLVPDSSVQAADTHRVNSGLREARQPGPSARVRRIDTEAADRARRASAPTQDDAAPVAVVPAASTTGKIAGTITDAATGQPLASNCNVEIEARDASGHFYENGACTTSAGKYTIANVPAGTYTVEFFDSEDGYLTQYYNGKASSDTATKITVKAGATKSSVNAALVSGGIITGTISDAKTGSPLASNCNVSVSAENTATFANFFSNGCTDASGKYTVIGLPTGTYTVQFSDSSDNYVSQYYNGQTNFNQADTVNATAGATTSGIDAALAKGGKITGTISAAATGTPLANHCGVYVEADDPTTGAVVASDFNCTDASGHYTISGLPAGSYKVYFQDNNPSDNYASQWYNGKATFGTATVVTVSSGATTSGINAAMAIGGTITGTVTDAKTGNPLASSCNVSVQAENVTTQSFYYAAGCLNASGAYTITGLSTGSYTVRFFDSTDGYISQWYNGEDSNNSADPVSVTAGSTTSGIGAALVKGGTIAGTITDANSTAPLANSCHVQIQAQNTASGAFYFQSSCLDSSGAYTLTGLPSGSYTVEFIDTADDYVPQFYSGDPVTVTAGATTSGVNAAMVVGGTIAGTVTAASDGHVLSDVCVNVFPASDLNVSVGNDCTDGSGKYSVGSLPTGNYTVEFFGDGASNQYISQYYNDETSQGSADLVSVTVGTTTSGVDAAMVLGGSISGSVTNASGHPIAGVCIAAYVDDGTDFRFAGVPDACTDSTGHYQTGGLPAGDYQLDAFAPSGTSYIGEWYGGSQTQDGSTAVTVALSSVTTGTDFTLQTGGTISGTVTAAADGTPLADVSVCPTLVGSNSGNCWPTNADGTYTTAGLPDGSYTVFFSYFTNPNSTTSYVSQYYDGATTITSATPVKITGGANVTGIDAALVQTQSGAIAGTITDASTGKPINNECVLILSSGGGFSGSACTNSVGKYVVRGLTAGSNYVVETQSEGRSPYLDQTYASHVTVTAGATTSGIDFSLTRGATISGQVTDSQTGTPLQGVCVNVSGPSGSGSGCTDASGDYTTSGVPAGTYTVDFTDVGGRYIAQFYDGAQTSGSATPVTVTLGQTKTGIDAAMVLGGNISGTVTAAKGGAPLPNICITLEHADGTFAANGGCTNSKGQYTSSAVAAGSYVVAFADASKTYATQYYKGSTNLAGATAVPVTVGATTPSIDAAMVASGPVKPVVSSVSPARGSTAGGTLVTITGSGFTGATAVTFGTTAGTNVVVKSDTSITVTSPAHAAVTLNVRVTTPVGESAVVTPADQFTYTNAPVLPVVSSVSPSSGSTAGGTSVTVTGSGFSGATAVTFGGTAGTNVVVNSDTSVTVTSPKHAAGTVNVRVTTPVGQSAVVTPADQFTYAVPPPLPVVSSVSPTSGTAAGGTSVTVTGTGFTGATSVTFGGIAGTNVVVNSDTSLTVTSPAHAAATVDVQVTTPAGQSAVVTPADQFTYTAVPVVPTVTGVSPSAGATAGGTAVTITGTGFTGATSATFGGTAGTNLVVNSDTQITVTSPAHAAGTVNVRVTTPAGQSAISAADQFSYSAKGVAPAVSGLDPASGLPAGGTGVTVTGTGFTASSTVTFGGVAAAWVTFVSSTELTVVSPAHAAGVVDVRVTTAAGQSAVVAADQFTYAAAPTITGLAPTSGTTAGGTSVTITGTGFTPDATVSFGSGNEATSVTYVSSTELIAVSPPHPAGTVSVTVTTGSGTSAVVSADRYKYV